MNKPHTSTIKNFVLASSFTAFAVLMSTLSFAQTADAATTVIIKKGDSINEIAKAYAREHNMAFDTAYSKIITANPSAYAKGNPDKLIIGARLVLPNTSATPVPSTKTDEAAKTVAAPEVVTAVAAPAVVTAETTTAPAQAAAPVPSTAPAASTPAVTPAATPVVVAPAVPTPAAATPVANWDSYIVMPIWAMCLLGIAFLMLLVRLLRRKPAPILDIDGNEMDASALTPPKVNINLPLKDSTPSEIASIEVAEMANVIEPIAKVDVKADDSAHQHPADQIVAQAQHAIDTTEGNNEITVPSPAITDHLDVIEPLPVIPVEVVAPKVEPTEPVPAKNLGVTFANALTPVGLTQAKINSNHDVLPKSTFSHIDLSKFGIPVAKLTIHDQIEATEKSVKLAQMEPNQDVVSEQDNSIDAAIVASTIPTEPLTLPETKVLTESNKSQKMTLSPEELKMEESTSFRRVSPMSLPDLDLGKPATTDTVEDIQTESSETKDDSVNQQPSNELQTTPDVKPVIIQHSDSDLKTAFVNDNAVSQGNKSVAVAVEPTPIPAPAPAPAPAPIPPVVAPAQAASSLGVDLDVSGFMRRFSHQVPPEPMPPAIDFEDLLDRTHLQAWLNQRTPEEVLMCAQDAHDENYDDIAEVMLADVLFRGDAEQCSVAARLRRLWTAQRYR